MERKEYRARFSYSEKQSLGTNVELKVARWIRKVAQDSDISVSNVIRNLIEREYVKYKAKKKKL